MTKVKPSSPLSHPALATLASMPTKDVNSFLRVLGGLGTLQALRYIARVELDTALVDRQASPREHAAAVELHDAVEAAVIRFSRAIAAGLPPEIGGSAPVGGKVIRVDFRSRARAGRER